MPNIHLLLQFLKKGLIVSLTLPGSRAVAESILIPRQSENCFNLGGYCRFASEDFREYRNDANGL